MDVAGVAPNRHRSSRNREKRARSGCASGMMYSRFFVAFLQVILILQKFGRQGTRHVPRRIPQYRVSYPYSWCCFHRRESPYTHKPARVLVPFLRGGGFRGGFTPPAKYCTVFVLVRVLTSCLILGTGAVRRENPSCRFADLACSTATTTR